MNTKLDFSKKDIYFNGTENEKKLKEELLDDSLIISQKDKEIERLNKTLEETQRSYTYEYNLRHKLSFELSIEKSKTTEQQQEIERLNKFEKWIEEQIKISQTHKNQLGVNFCNICKNKLNELKGVIKNDKKTIQNIYEES